MKTIMNLLALIANIAIVTSKVKDTYQQLTTKEKTTSDNE